MATDLLGVLVGESVGDLRAGRLARLRVDPIVDLFAFDEALDQVFADEFGRPFHPNWLSESFRRHREGAGIPTGTLHTLRHTAATLALTAGVPVEIVAARLGDVPKTVLATYAHLLPQSDEVAAERVAAALSA